MEYVYAAMLLHKAGQKVDEARIKALVASLANVDIDDAIKQAAVAPVAAVAASAPAAEQKAEAPKEEKKAPEEAAAGLGSLFG